MKPTQIQANMGQSSIRQDYTRIDGNIFFGNLKPWFFKRAMPAEIFNSYEQLFEDDAQLFLAYMEERAKLFGMKYPVEQGEKKEPVVNREITDLEDSLELFNRYYDSPIGKKDQAEFEKIKEERLQEWLACGKQDEEAHEQNETVAENALNEPDRNEITEEVQRQRDYHKPVVIPESNEEIVSPQEPDNLGGVSQEVAPVSEQETQPGVIRLQFPPFMILKQAVDKRRKMREQIIQLHDLTLNNLQQAEATILEKEEAVRKYDDEKAPYVYRKMRVPDELMEKLTSANDEVLRAKKSRDETAQMYYQVHGLAIGLLESETQKVSTIRPRVQNNQSDFKTVDSEELTTAARDHCQAFVERELIKDLLISVLTQNPLEFNLVENAIKKIRANDFNSLKDILPEELEVLVPGEVGIIELWKMVDDLTTQQEIIIRTNGIIEGVNPTQLTGSRLHCCQELSNEVGRFENNLQLYIAKDEKPKKRVIKELESKIQHLELQRKHVSSCYYRDVIENTVPNSQEKSQQTETLALMVSEVMKREKTNSPENALATMLEENYRQIRKCGEPIPPSSLQGVAHDPLKTIVFAGKSKGGVEAIPAEEGDGWQYRAPKKLIHELLLDHTEKHDRISARLVANPETIKTLDELAKKFKFTYKIPSEERYWKRADTVTIYFIDLPDEEGQKEIAESLQKFVFEGDDNNLLGIAILNDKSTPYKGVRTNHGTTLHEMADMIKSAYEIDPMLGDAMTEYYRIRDIDGDVEFSGSPGMIEAGRKLLRELELKSS